MKMCSTCTEVMPDEMFYLRRKDGKHRETDCKTCARLRRRCYPKNKEVVNEGEE